MIIMGKDSKSKSNRGTNRSSSELRLRDPDANESYAEVISALGFSSFSVQILNGTQETAKLKGSMTRGRGFEKVNKNDWVLVFKDPSTTSKEKYYIIHKYSDNEKKNLEKLGELKSVCEVEETSNFRFASQVIEEDTNKKEIDDSFIDDI